MSDEVVAVQDFDDSECCVDGGAGIFEGLTSLFGLEEVSALDKFEMVVHGCTT